MTPALLARFLHFLPCAFSFLCRIHSSQSPPLLHAKHRQESVIADTASVSRSAAQKGQRPQCKSQRNSSSTSCIIAVRASIFISFALFSAFEHIRKSYFFAGLLCHFENILHYFLRVFSRFVCQQHHKKAHVYRFSDEAC